MGIKVRVRVRANPNPNPNANEMQMSRLKELIPVLPVFQIGINYLDGVSFFQFIFVLLFHFLFFSFFFLVCSLLLPSPQLVLWSI